MGCGSSTSGGEGSGGAKLVEVRENKGKGYWDQVIRFGVVSSKKAGPMQKVIKQREGEWCDPETGDKEWPSEFDTIGPLVSAGANSEDPLVREAAKTGWKVEVLHNNNGSNQHDQGHPDDGNQMWGSDSDKKSANQAQYPVDLNGWHTGYLVRRLRRNQPGKDNPEGQYDCWYEVAMLQAEYSNSPSSNLYPYPGPKEGYEGKVHGNMKKNFFGGDAIRPYVPGRAEFEDIPCDFSWECNGAAAWHIQGQADICRYKAALTGDKAMAAMAAEKQAKADSLKN